MTNSNSLFTITEVSSLTGVHPQTLRNWEKQELIVPIRVAGNQRIYTEAHVERVHEILSLKDEGLRLKGVLSVLSGKKTSFKPTTEVSRPRMASAAQTLVKTAPKKATPTATATATVTKPVKPVKPTATKPVKPKATVTKPVAPKAEVVAEKPKQTRKPRAKFKVAELEAMTLADLNALAKTEQVLYFRQMLKDELVTAIAYPSLREEMKEQAKARTKERYGHKVYGERESANDPIRTRTRTVAQKQEPNKAEFTEENEVSKSGLVEANEVQSANEDINAQEQLIQNILNMGKTGKTPEEIAKELAKSYK